MKFSLPRHLINKRVDFLLLILFVVLMMFFAGIRFYKLTADPDASLTWSKEFFGDESYHTGNAVKKYLRDTWICDELNNMAAMPLMPFIQFHLFKLIGLNLFSARLPSVILSVFLIVGLAYYIFEGHRNSDILMFLMLLYIIVIGSNYYFFVYSRVALLDVPMISFGFISLLLFNKALTPKEGLYRKEFYFLSGLFLSGSYLIKPTGIIFLLTSIIVFIITAATHKFKVKEFKYFFIMLLTFLVIVFCSNLIVKEIFGRIYFETTKSLIGWKVNESLIGTIKNYIRFFNNYLVKRNAGLLLLALINIYIINLKSRKIEIPLQDISMIALSFVSYLFLGFFSYQPPRYFLILLVPITYLVVTLPINFMEFFELNDVKKRYFISLFCFIIILVNFWNFNKLYCYLKNPNFSIPEMAEKIRVDIGLDNGAEEVIVCGDSGPLMALLGINKNDFYYDYNSIKQDYLKRRVYYLIEEDASSPVSDSQLKYINTYVILKQWNNLLMRFYKVEY